jgi:hypothetical protein
MAEKFTTVALVKDKAVSAVRLIGLATTRRRFVYKLGGSLLVEIIFDHLFRLRAEEGVDVRESLAQLYEALGSGAVLERFREPHGLISLDGLAWALAEPGISLRITFAQINEVL